MNDLKFSFLVRNLFSNGDKMKLCGGWKKLLKSALLIINTYFPHAPAPRYSSSEPFWGQSTFLIPRFPLFPLSSLRGLHKHVKNSEGVALLHTLGTFPLALPFWLTSYIHGSSWPQFLSSGQWARE